jgi:hypothetical protein
MIKCSRGNVGLSGTKAVLLAEFSTIVFVLNERKILTEEELRDAFEDGFKTQKKIDGEILGILREIFSGVLSDCKKEDE